MDKEAARERLRETALSARLSVAEGLVTSLEKRCNDAEAGTRESQRTANLLVALQTVEKAEWETATVLAKEERRSERIKQHIAAAKRLSDAESALHISTTQNLSTKEEMKALKDMLEEARDHQRASHSQDQLIRDLRSEIAELKRRKVKDEALPEPPAAVQGRSPSRKFEVKRDHNAQLKSQTVGKWSSVDKDDGPKARTDATSKARPLQSAPLPKKTKDADETFRPSTKGKAATKPKPKAHAKSKEDIENHVSDSDDEFFRRKVIQKDQSSKPGSRTTSIQSPIKEAPKKKMKILGGVQGDLFTWDIPTVSGSAFNIPTMLSPIKPMR